MNFQSFQGAAFRNNVYFGGTGHALDASEEGGRSLPLQRLIRKDPEARVLAPKTLHRRQTHHQARQSLIGRPFTCGTVEVDLLCFVGAAMIIRPLRYMDVKSLSADRAGSGLGLKGLPVKGGEGDDQPGIRGFIRLDLPKKICIEWMCQIHPGHNPVRFRVTQRTAQGEGFMFAESAQQADLPAAQTPDIGVLPVGCLPPDQPKGKRCVPLLFPEVFLQDEFPALQADGNRTRLEIHL